MSLNFLKQKEGKVCRKWRSSWMLLLPTVKEFRWAKQFRLGREIQSKHKKYKVI